MAFPAYKFMDIPEVQVESEDLDHQSLIMKSLDELLDVFPPITFLSLTKTRPSSFARLRRNRTSKVSSLQYTNT